MVGKSYSKQTVVDSTNVASAVGSGTLEVFSTPMMAALMEAAASECLQPYLAPGQTSVGSFLKVAHLSPTPVGLIVNATATITAVDKNKVTFEVIASDEKGIIGSGEHVRHIVDADQFLAGAQKKSR